MAAARLLIWILLLGEKTAIFYFVPEIYFGRKAIKPVIYYF